MNIQNWKTNKLKHLAKALLSIDSEKDMMNFLRDLCTLEELEELSDRWEVVLLLDKGTPYREITKKTGVSTTTVTRIALWLNSGEAGYEVALKKQKP